MVTPTSAVQCYKAEAKYHIAEVRHKVTAWRALIPAGAGAPVMEIVHSGHIRLGNIDL